MEDLVSLIDLSLGVEPNGVVNFNYLHGLMHGIVKKLVELESYTRGESGLQVKDAQAGVMQAQRKDSRTQAGVMQAQGKDSHAQAGVMQEQEKDSGASPTKDAQGRETQTSGKYAQVKDAPQAEAKGVQAKVSETAEGEEQDGEGEELSRADSGTTSASPKQTSRTSVRSLSRSRPTIVSAANDLGALERKLLSLDQRMSAVETLPEMLDRIATDASATPVSDMWNFTLMNNRLAAAEEGVGKVSNCY